MIGGQTQIFRRARSLRLANSGLTVRLSWMASFRPDGKLCDGRGVEPEPVGYTAGEAAAVWEFLKMGLRFGV